MHYLTLPYLAVFLVYFLSITNFGDKEKQYILLWIITIVGILFIGATLYLQPIAGDPYRYARYFYKISYFNFSEMLNFNQGELLFKFLNWIVGQMTNNFRILLIVLYLMFFIGLYKALSIIYKTKDKYLILGAIILYPYVIAYVESAKRQGIALVLMLLSIAYIFKGNNYKWLFFLILIPFFHSGSALVIPVLILFYFYKDKKDFFFIALLIYIFTLIMAFTNLNKTLIDLIPQYFQLNPSHQQYFIQNGEFARIHYKVGFRWDFTLFSIFPLVLYFIFKTDNKEIKQWLGLYLLLNSLYNVFCAIPFSDRIAVFSWFIWPIVNFEILKVYNKKYAYLFLLLLFFSGIILLQFYTKMYFLPLNLI